MAKKIIESISFEITAEEFKKMLQAVINPGDIPEYIESFEVDVDYKWVGKTSWEESSEEEQLYSDNWQKIYYIKISQ